MCSSSTLIPPILGHPVPQARNPVRGDLHVLITDLAGRRHRRPRQRRRLGLGGHQHLHRRQRRQHHPKGMVAGGRVVPVGVQRRLQAGCAQHTDACLGGQRRGPLGQPPPLLARDHTQSLAQGVSHQVVGVLHPARPPQRTGVQRRPKLPASGRAGRQRHGAFHQPPVQVRLDQPGPEVEQRTLGKRWLLGVQAAQHQLPTPVHHRRLDHLIIGGTGVGLHDQRQRQLRRRHRRLPFGAVGVHPRQLGLELFAEQLMTTLPQHHKQLRPSDPFDNLLLGR
jgi:hypothetical protein